MKTSRSNIGQGSENLLASLQVDLSIWHRGAPKRANNDRNDDTHYSGAVRPNAETVEAFALDGISTRGGCRSIFARIGTILRRLGNLGMRKRNSFSPHSNDKGNEYGVESISATSRPLVLQANLQVPMGVARGAIGYEIRASSSTLREAGRGIFGRGRTQERESEKVKKTMPVVALKPHQMVTPWFVYPNNGKCRLYLEASESVDVIVCRPDQVKVLISTAAAGIAGALYYSGKTYLDEIITLPEAWRSTGWHLIIGNAGGGSKDVSAVFYFVFPAT